MIKCPYCGYENKDDASFCIMCKEVFKTIEREIKNISPSQITFKEFEKPGSGWILYWRSRTMYIFLIILIALVCYYIIEAHPRLVSMIKYMSTYASPPKKIPLTPTKEEEQAKESMEVAYTMGDYSDILANRKSTAEKSKKDRALSDYKEVEYFVTDDYIYYSIGEFTYVKQLTSEEKEYVAKGAVEKVVKEEKPPIYIVERPVPPSLPSRKNIVHTTSGGTWILPDETKPNYNLKRNLPKLFDVKRPRVDKKQIYLYDLKTETLGSKGKTNVNVPNLKRTEQIHLSDLHKEKLVLDRLDKQTVGRDKISRKKISN